MFGWVKDLGAGIRKGVSKVGDFFTEAGNAFSNDPVVVNVPSTDVPAAGVIRAGPTNTMLIVGVALIAIVFFGKQLGIK